MARSKKASHSDRVSAGMRKNAGARSKQKKKAGAKYRPAKHIIFDATLAALKAGRDVDVDELAKKYPHVERGTIASWVGSWYGDSPNLPTIGDRDTAKELKAAITKYNRS